MKKTALLLILSFLTSFYSSAQSWVKEDAVWHYDYYVTGSGFYTIELSNDTLILGKNCNKYVTKKHQFFSQPGGVYLQGPVIDLPSRYTHTSGDTVFYYENNQFYTLFNFGASIGDQWTINDVAQFPEIECNALSIVEVIDTDNIDINGTNRRAILLKTLDGSSVGINGWVVENVGPLGSQYLFPTPNSCSDSQTVCFEQYSFKCFQDSRINLYNPSGVDCEYLLTHLGIAEDNNQDFQVFPNPTTDVVNILFNKVGTHLMTLTDHSGKVILEKSLSNVKEEIDMTQLPSGIYTIRIENVNNEVRIERIVKR